MNDAKQRDWNTIQMEFNEQSGSPREASTLRRMYENIKKGCSFDETKVHLRTLGEFLSEWKWLVLTRPTHVLVDGILDSHSELLVPLTSLLPETQAQVPFGYRMDTWPEDLKRLVVRCSSNQSSYPTEAVSPPTNSDYDENSVRAKKATVKKRHEISRLSKFVASICCEQSVKCVVDVGSGLGYVDRELCQMIEGCRILAIESEEARCTSADEVNKILGLRDRIVQLPKKLHSSNANEVSDVIGASAESDCCLIALHACGDLTPLALRLFQDNHLIKNAVILSCCYHRMSYSSENGITSFSHFPSSETLKSLLADGSVDPALVDVSCLRLAAESTRELWASRSPENLCLHARSVAFRALVQSYEEKYGVKFTKTRRRAVKSSSRQTWSAYVAAWVANTESTRRSDGQPLNRSAVLEELSNFCSDSQVESIIRNTMAFNTLRTCIQQLVESFVLVDRLLALKEAGFAESSLVRISDPAISPRSVAIVVNK